jgi:hypothetical protein
MSLTSLTLNIGGVSEQVNVGVYIKDLKKDELYVLIM